MNVDGNEKNPHSHGKKFTDFYCHHNCHNILNDDYKICLIFKVLCMVFLELLFFNDWCPVFCGTVFLLLDCQLFVFTLYCFAVRVCVGMRRE